MAELAGGTVARGVVDAYPRRRKPVRVRLRMSRVERVLGVAPPRAQARRILIGLGLAVTARGARARRGGAELPARPRDGGRPRRGDHPRLGLRPDPLHAARRRRRSRSRTCRSGCGRRPSCGRPWPARGCWRRSSPASPIPSADGVLDAGPDAKPVPLLNPLSADALHPAGPSARRPPGRGGDERRAASRPTCGSSRSAAPIEQVAGGDTGTAEPRWAAIARDGRAGRAVLARRRRPRGRLRRQGARRARAGRARRRRGDRAGGRSAASSPTATPAW